jgi:nickel transport protein
VAHRFFANLGAGHIADVTMPAEEVAAILGQAPLVTAAPSPAPGAAPGAGAPDPGAQRALLAEVVRDEMRPLRREIAAYREKNDLQTILGGMGYIAGLFGLGFYLAARRRLREAGLS